MIWTKLNEKQASLKYVIKLMLFPALVVFKTVKGGRK